MNPNVTSSRSARRRSRRAGGFTLVETMFVCLFFALLLGLVAGMSLNAARLSSVVTTSAGLQSRSHIQCDTFINDVHDSEQVLSTYTAANGTTDSSSTQSALILEAPAYTAGGTIPTTTDASGNVVPASYDHIVYHLVAASGSNDPYTLNRLVDTAGGSACAASADTVLTSNVQAATFTCLVDQPIKGNGVDTSFGLNSQIDLSGLGMGVTMNGAAVALGAAASQAQFNLANATKLGTVDFGAAPANNAVIDAVYPVDPSNAANGGNVTHVKLDLTLSVTDTTLGPSGTQTTVLTSTGYLRNQ